MPNARNGTRPHWIILHSRLVMGHDAFTLVFWTFVRGAYCSPTLRAHENRHVWQAIRWWVLPFWIAYLLEYLLWIVVGLVTGNARTTFARAYHRISWEQDAYRWGAANADAFDPVGTPP